MSFREKTRWAALIIDLPIWAWYFSRVAEVLPEGPADEMDFFWLAVGATVATIVIHVGAQILFAIQSPREAGAALDERERAIEQRAGSPPTHCSPSASSTCWSAPFSAGPSS